MERLATAQNGTATELEIQNIYNDLVEKVNIPILDQLIIDAPNTAHYLSDFMDDLPHNAYINKGITGCGGTTLAITNNQPYVIVVHSTNVVENKANQHKNLCPIYNKTENAEIKDYIEYSESINRVQKFIVTYDSLPRLLNFINPKNFRLLVDEVQVLIRYLGHFKTTVAHNLLERAYEFKSTSYLTATPTLIDFLPTSIKQLQYVEIKWSNIIKPVINHAYCGKQIQTNICSFILDKYENTDDEIYVFYNSKNGVAATIEKLLMLNSELNITDINIIFANTQENTKFFRNKFKYKKLYVGYQLDIDDNGALKNTHNKRINFISSFGFEGVDFYTFGKNVTTLIVADSFSKSMRYDVSIDIPQILGRFRRDKTTGLFPENNIFFIWKTIQQELLHDNVESIIKSISKNIYVSQLLLKTCNDIFDQNEKQDRKDMVKRLDNEDPYLIPEDAHVDHYDRTYMPNKYAMEGIMSVYSTVNIDYQSFANTNVDDGTITNSLADISSKVDTFSIPKLNSKQSELLSRQVPFSKIAREYYDLYMEDKMRFSNDNKDKMAYLLDMSDLLRDCLDHCTIENIKGYNFREKHFIKFVEEKVNLDNLLRNIKNEFKVGDLIKESDILSVVTNLYNKYNIKEKPKKAFLSKILNFKHRCIDSENYIDITKIR